MRSRKGFTLVELMVVILIVGILAAVAIPLMRGRIDSAKWSEGKSVMGTIATGIRAYCAENGHAGTAGLLSSTAVATPLGFAQADLVGTYFTSPGMFEITTWTYDANDLTHPLVFTIKATNSVLNPSTYTLSQSGAFQ